MIWRGPMVMSALSQMLKDVAWGDLDVLVVDMPPGTGDAQLTMAQQVPLAGAVIVSTPQDLALIDARKGLNMFRKVNVPVLGIVENMSTFICPHCGERADIFGHGGARSPKPRGSACRFSARCRLTLAIRETSDSGKPVVGERSVLARAPPPIATSRRNAGQSSSATRRRNPRRTQDCHGELRSLADGSDSVKSDIRVVACVGMQPLCPRRRDQKAQAQSPALCARCRRHPCAAARRRAADARHASKSLRPSAAENVDPAAIAIDPVLRYPILTL